MAADGPSGQIEVVVTRYGRPATVALAERVAAARGGHPLEPVTVIVPSNAAGLSARRILGSGQLGGRGLANVAFVTPFRLAELLGAGAVGDRRPLTNPVLAAAARAVLAEAPGHFADVAGHEATQSALVRLYGELSRAAPATLAAIAGRSERGADVVRLVRAIATRLAGHHDEDDLAEAATRRLDADPTVARELGAVIWHLPERLSPAMTVLVREVLVAAPSAVVVAGLTGADDADAGTRALCAAAGVPLDPTTTVEPTHADRIISASDPDEEVRAVVRELAGLAASGARLDRTAVLFPTAEPYARTIHEQLDAAGIPHNGPSVARLADGVAGRTLLAALALAELGWGRGDVVGLVAGAPVRHQGRPAPAARWDATSREAGVVGGRDDWATRLGGHAARLRVEAGAGPEGDQGERRRRRLEDEATAAEELAAFVADLAARLDGLGAAPTWRERVEAARSLLEGLLGPEHQRTRWPEHEVAAAQRVDVALGRLVVLDEVEPAGDLRSFALAVAAELAAPGGRIGRFGDGVLVAPLAAAVGLDLDACFVVGMAEGTCPSFRREDGLLPDDDRVLAVAGELTTRADRLADQHRHLLAALAAAARRTLVLPRGDLRDRRTRLPSRWLLASASHHAGRTLFSGDLDQLGPPHVEVVASFADGIARASTHGTLAERDLATVLHHLAAGGELAAHPVAGGELGRGLACHRSRLGPSFTEWDGNVGGLPVPSPATGTPVSASRLETWASCPLRYFFGHVLRLGDRDDPEEVVELGAADRGSLVHEVLERFIGEAIARDGGPPAPDEPWGPGDRARLVTIAEEAFARYETSATTGRPLLWQRTRADVVEELLAFLARDDAHRAADGLRPVSVEMAFGVDGEAPLALALPDGREVAFRGRADRVDEAADGRLVVLDYKTGRDGYAKLGDDPVLGGTTLQLGVYAEAARARHGRDEVDARYWMASTKARFVQRGYPWTEARRARFLDVVGTIVEGIEAGTFPGRPGTYDAFFGTHARCGHCEFDRICPRDRDDHEQAMAAAPELSLLRLLEAPAEDDPEPVAGGDGDGDGDDGGGGA